MSFTVSPGITGLLGPNGAGKSTRAAHARPASSSRRPATVTVLGEPAWRNPALYRQLGLVPERESVYGSLTGYEFVRLNARLQGLADPGRGGARGDPARSTSRTPPAGPPAATRRG